MKASQQYQVMFNEEVKAVNLRFQLIYSARTRSLHAPRTKAAAGGPVRGRAVIGVRSGGDAAHHRQGGEGANCFDGYWLGEMKEFQLSAEVICV